MKVTVQAVVVKRSGEEDIGRLVFRFAEEIIKLLESGHKTIIVRLADDEEDTEILERIATVVLGYMWEKFEGSDLESLKEVSISTLGYRELVISMDWML